VTSPYLEEPIEIQVLLFCGLQQHHLEGTFLTLCKQRQYVKVRLNVSTAHGHADLCVLHQGVVHDGSVVVGNWFPMLKSVQVYHTRPRKTQMRVGRFYQGCYALRVHPWRQWDFLDQGDNESAIKLEQNRQTSAGPQ
jgi:hypothetical protein